MSGDDENISGRRISDWYVYVSLLYLFSSSYLMTNSYLNDDNIIHHHSLDTCSIEGDGSSLDVEAPIEIGPCDDVTARSINSIMTIP